MAENGILDYQGMNQAIYRGATSNIIVDTQSMSIEIGAGNSSHTSNLHIECDHDANVASIQLNSNVVTEFSRSKKLIKYPRVAMTSAAATSPGYEEYIATASSSYNNASIYDAWAAFNGNVEEGTQEGWLSISGSYDNATPSLPVTSGSNAELFNSRYGDWLNIKLPNKIVLSKLHTYPRTGNENPGVVRDYEHPDAGYLYGSNDGFSTFQEIYSFDGVPVSTTFRVPTIHTVNATKAYNEYRFQVTKLKGQRTFAAISEMELFGVPEYDPEAHGTDVTVKSYPNVPNTDWLEVYYDAKGLNAGAVSTVNDLKPSSLGSALNSSSTNNITVADDAFVFNGTDSYIKINDLTNPSGAWIHSVATWVKFTDFDSSQEVSWIGDADGSAIRQSFSFQPGGETVTMGISGSNVQFRFASPLTPGKWHHVVYTYIGGSAGSASTAYQVFIDGVEASKFAGVGTGTLTLPADSVLWIGTNHNGTNHFGGSVANFRLFNRALTSDEIYQLYAYQKEDFGHSTNNMTLKAGRLGIGTSEPRAALDVRGDIIGGCPVFFSAWCSTQPDTNTNAVPKTIIWNKVTSSKGGGYDASTGIFTAPLPGYYRFYYTARCRYTQGCWLRVYVNNAYIEGDYKYHTVYLSTGGMQGGNEIIVKLEQGHDFRVVFLTTNNQTSGIADNYNGFNGQYISSL
jgi:hypothetical protein